MASEAELRIARNLEQVEERIRASCARSGRPRSAVTLVAVSKMRTLEETLAACACGVRNLGEDRVEELQWKVPAVAQQWHGEALTWHMIGHLQSRKVRDVLALCQMMHSLDSLSLATKLNAQAAKVGTVLPVLVECNVSGEVTKYGFPAWERSGWQPLAEELHQLEQCTCLSVRGLMTMAPIVSVPEQARPCFGALRELSSYLQRELAGIIGSELSMGMTDDFEVAIEEGATMVRIGRAIFS